MRKEETTREITNI